LELVSIILSWSFYKRMWTWSSNDNSFTN